MRSSRCPTNGHVADSTDSDGRPGPDDGRPRRFAERITSLGNRPPHGDLVAKARHEVETSPPFLPGSVLVGHCSSRSLGVVSLDSPLVPRKSGHTFRGVLRDQRSRWHVWQNGVPSRYNTRQVPGLSVGAAPPGTDRCPGPALSPTEAERAPPDPTWTEGR